VTEQRSQGGQVLNVFFQILGLGRFETTRGFFEPGIIDDVAKTVLADPTLADVRVSIHFRAERRLGVVQVKGKDLATSN